MSRSPAPYCVYSSECERVRQTALMKEWKVLSYARTAVKTRILLPWRTGCLTPAVCCLSCREVKGSKQWGHTHNAHSLPLLVMLWHARDWRFLAQMLRTHFLLFSKQSTPGYNGGLKQKVAIVLPLESRNSCWIILFLFISFKFVADPWEKKWNTPSPPQ